MRILYAGWLHTGSTSSERRDTLSELGHEVIGFDMGNLIAGAGRIETSLMGRYAFGKRIRQMNEQLLRLSQGEAYDLVWVDKGIWLYPETLVAIRDRSSQGLAIHYTPDAQVVDNRSRFYIKSIPIYDLNVTTKRFEVDLLRKLGSRGTFLTYQGYGAKFAAATPAMARAEFASEVCFIGHSQRHYRRTLRPLAAAGFDVKIWGPNWPRWRRVEKILAPHILGSGLWGADYPAALVSSKIALGLLSKFIRETTTSRTFEIPATGTFMLAERNDDHCSLFEEGKEAEFFSSPQELRDKIAFYLRHEEARQRIAAMGRERSLRDGYSTTRRLSDVIAHLNGAAG